MTVVTLDRSASTPPGSCADIAAPIGVLNRAFTILESFGPGERLSLHEVTSRTGLPKPTVHRLLQTLVERGGIDLAPDGGYQLGIGLFELGHQTPQHVLRTVAAPHLRSLHEQTHATVHLAILDGTDVVYLEKLDSGTRTSPSRVGGRLPAHCTALGKAILAQMPSDGVRSALGPAYRARTPYSIVVPSVLAEELEAVRRSGYAVDREEAQLGLTCVASVVRVRSAPIAGVSISKPSSSASIEQMARLIALTARRITRDLRDDESRGLDLEGGSKDV